MKRIDSINVIPMIDIMLVMLAIVLTTASFINVGKIKVDLPTVQTVSSSYPQALHRIIVDANEQVFLNDTSITLLQLERTVAELTSDTPITLKVDQNASFGKFATVVDLLNRHQLDQVSIIVAPDK